MTTPAHSAADGLLGGPAGRASDPVGGAAAGGTTAGGRVLAERYRLGRRIGAGGMATILRGTDLQMDREIAVKVLHAHLADDPEVRTRFRAEARHAASLSHPHVVTVYDQGEADLPYIILELVDGPSLREVLARHGPLSPEQALAIVEPLCNALDAAHRIGLIHRDIKPENVLVTTEGMPKLADFGIARVMAATSHTATGTLVGSVHYLAPELVDGVDATPASDQYALAVVAFELLTGRKPLPAETPMAIALRHANEDVPPPSRYAPEVPAALDGVIARATARRAADRYPDMAAMAAGLRAAVDGGPAPVTHLGDDGVLHTLVLPSDHVPTTRLGGAVTRQPAPPPGRDRPAGRGRPARRRIGIGLTAVAVVALLAVGGWLAWTSVLAPPTLLADLVGERRGDAFAQLEADGLRLDIGAEEHRVDVPAGVVIAQDPPPGTPLRDGDRVRVTLSLGPATVPMPTVVGLSEAEARRALDADAFEVAVAQAHDDEVPVGQVIAQDPAAGDLAVQGTPVTITLSLGIEQVTVPALVGQTIEEAEAALAGVRLTAEVTEEWSDEVADAGVVISQSTGEGTQVDARSTVALVVSRGPLTIEVPDLIGLPVGEALAVVAALGDIAAAERTGPVPTLGPFTLGTTGRVERQVPAPGEAIQRGGTIDLYYFVDG